MYSIRKCIQYGEIFPFKGIVVSTLEILGRTKKPDPEYLILLSRRVQRVNGGLQLVVADCAPGGGVLPVAGRLQPEHLAPELHLWPHPGSRLETTGSWISRKDS